MSYIDKSLAPGEVLLYRARFHWGYHAAAWGALILAAIVALALLVNGVIVSALMTLSLGGIVFVAILTPIWTTEIGVTDQRVVFKRGIIERETNELQLGSVERVSFEQDFWGRLFDYGRIHLHGTGDGDMALPSLADPLALRAALQQAIGHARGEDNAGHLAPSGDEKTG